MSGAIGSRAIGAAAIGSTSGARPLYVGSGAIGTYPIGGASIGGTVGPYQNQQAAQASGGEWIITNRRRHRR